MSMGHRGPARFLPQKWVTHPLWDGRPQKKTGCCLTTNTENAPCSDVQSDILRCHVRLCHASFVHVYLKKSVRAKAQKWRRDAGGERGRDRGRDRWRWGKGKELQQNASISSKASLGPLQWVCSHMCTLVCFCPVGIYTLQSHCVLRWTPPLWP